MKAIKRNIVGLFKFICLLFCFSLPAPRRTPKTHQGLYDLARLEAHWARVALLRASLLASLPRSGPTLREEGDKYAGVIGPSVPLIPAETKFCPQCHIAVAQVRYTKRGTEIIQNGKVLLTVGGNVIISATGKESTGFPIRCSNGHIMVIE